MMTEPAQSPFLPGTNLQFAYDSTSIGYLKTCPRLYQYIMIDGWQPKGESLHLRFGSEYHEAIQDYEIAKAAGAKHEDAICTSIRNLLTRTVNWEVDEGSKAGNYKNRTTLIQLCIDYFDHYADDPAETLILENGKPAVELSFSFALDWGPRATYNEAPKGERGPIKEDGTFDIAWEPSYAQPYLLSGHLDRVVTFNDSIFVLDHKTTTTTPSQYFFAGFNPSNQMTLYTLAGRVVLDTPIRGVIVEAAQIMLDKPSRFVREPTHRTQDQLDEWVENLRYWFSLAETYAEANYWPMNDTACGMYGGCKFKEVCAKSPQVREIYLKSDFIKLAPEDRWNPLKPR
jgi:hypothetical protein